MACYAAALSGCRRVVIGGALIPVVEFGVAPVWAMLKRAWPGRASGLA